MIGGAGAIHPKRNNNNNKTDKDMVNEKPNVPPTARYTLREAAKILGVNAKTISRAIERGAMRCGYRKMNDMPYVEGKEIMRMWQESW